MGPFVYTFAHSRSRSPDEELYLFEYLDDTNNIFVTYGPYTAEIAGTVITFNLTKFADHKSFNYEVSPTTGKPHIWPKNTCTPDMYVGSPKTLKYIKTNLLNHINDNRLNLIYIHTSTCEPQHLNGEEFNKKFKTQQSILGSSIFNTRRGGTRYTKSKKKPTKRRKTKKNYKRR